MTPAVPDFEIQRKEKRFHGFSRAVYDNHQTMADFHASICNMAKACTNAKSTRLHECLDALARNGKLLRLYTQNIDELEYQLPNLADRTTQLHGSLARMRYQMCPSSGPFDPACFSSAETADCPQCVMLSLRRQANGERALAIGRLRPDIVLYGEDNPNGEAIRDDIYESLRKKPDMLVIIGTRKKVYGAKDLARTFARAVKAKGGCDEIANECLQGTCKEPSSRIN